ncbi:MAG: hypothetical protein NTU57_02575 [Candidatus Aenigmarchaeota archaeon]|nr:hypothetical protein [Candidatus Aenigmarchaeota archaeon]
MKRLNIEFLPLNTSKWKCRRCGCTDDKPCRDVYGKPCSWVKPDLCSECA